MRPRPYVTRSDRPTEIGAEDTLGRGFQGAYRMTVPEVTVYVPTRNRADLLRDAIGSVLSQTFSSIELIVVDDASTDETAAVLNELANQDTRVRTIRLPEKMGACAARNAAIEAARGYWCTGLDDDDIMLPNRIESLVLAAKSASGHSLVCSGFFVEQRGRRRKVLCRDANITLDELLHRNVIGNQALFRRDQALAIGGFDVEMPASQDYDFWTRLVERFGPALRIGEPTYVFREHRHTTARISNTTAALEGALRYTEKHRRLMSQRHLQTQRLVHAYVAGKPITLGLAASSINAANVGFALRYAAQRFPTLAALRDRLT
jgi:glycosyltransferase involved in cell wall biosynthesis